MDPKDTTDPFAKYGAKADEDPFAKYGAKADAPIAAAPVAVPTPKPEEPEPAPAPELSFGEKAARKGFAAALGMTEAVPFGTQIAAGLRSLFGPETYEEELAGLRGEQARAAELEPWTYGLSRFGMSAAQLPIVAGKALSIPAQAARFGAFGAAQAAGREGATPRSVLAEGAMSAAVPALFKGLNLTARSLSPAASDTALRAAGLRAGQSLIKAAPVAALSAAPISTLVSSDTSEAEKVEAGANLATLLGLPIAQTYKGAKRIGAERAASVAEQAEMEGRRVVAESEARRGEGAVAAQAGREAEQAIAQRREANKRAGREVAFEQSIDLAADKMKGGAQKAAAAVQTELANQQQLIQALENATDPSLLGWRAKQFQDMANRLNSYEASWTREYPGQPLPPEFNAVRSKLDQSLMRNTQLLGSNATENFLADPDAKFAEYQARKVAEGKTKEADLLQRLNNALAFANKDFNAEARAQAAARRTPLDDARRGAIYAKYGLVDPGPQAPFASPVLAERLADVSRGVSSAPTKKGELAALYREQGLPSGMTEADILRAANVTPAEAARLLAEQRAAARNRVTFGTTTPTAKTQREINPESTGRALWETVVPEWVQGGVRLVSDLGGRISGSNIAPRSLPEYTRRTSPTLSTESRMSTPFEALELASSFQRALDTDNAFAQGFRRFLNTTPNGTWLGYLRTDPVARAKMEAQRQAEAAAAANAAP